MKILSKGHGRIGILMMLAVVLICYPWIMNGSSYYMTLIILASIYGIATVALNLLTGYGGQISIGNAGFLTVGAYTVAILTQRYSAPMIVALPLAGLSAAAVSLLMGIPAGRLRGHFLAMVSLAFGLAIPEIALNWDSVTFGYNGIKVQRPLMLANDTTAYYIIILISCFAIWIMKNIVDSRYGRAFSAIRDSETAASAAGINVEKYKALMFAISALFTGVAGGLYAYWFQYVSPADFTIITSLLLLAMGVVGGLRSVAGGIIGASILITIPNFTTAWVGSTDFVIGCIVVLIIMIMPDGIRSLVKYK